MNDSPTPTPEHDDLRTRRDAADDKQMSPRQKRFLSAVIAGIVAGGVLGALLAYGIIAAVKNSEEERYRVETERRQRLNQEKATERFKSLQGSKP